MSKWGEAVRRMVVELTNRCNLTCGHCFEERHAGTGDLPDDIIESLFRDAHLCGINHFSFTGGEPTLHRRFASIVSQLCNSGYTFSFVSNGSTFGHIYPLLEQHRTAFHGVTFSLDGAREDTHDRLRGAGSYRQVMRAISICVVRDLPYTINMVITAQNRNEVEQMTQLAARLGSRGVRFGHLMAKPESDVDPLSLSLNERRETENEIWQLQRTASVAVGMAPGYYNASPFFPCGPLELQEANLDYRGNLTLCCQLSGYGDLVPGTDVIGNLRQMTLQEAWHRFEAKVRVYLGDKRARVEGGEFGELDYFPCWYCVKYLGKVPHATPRQPSAPISHNGIERGLE
jgi:MoaA/NifB/PqqE/SkfB family radical SAM enzyme